MQQRSWLGVLATSAISGVLAVMTACGGGDSTPAPQVNSLLAPTPTPTPSNRSQTFAVSLTVPSSCWRLVISGIFRVQTELWVVSVVSFPFPSPVCLPGLLTATDEVTIEAPALSARHFLMVAAVGVNPSAWAGQYDDGQPHTVVTDPQSFLEQVDRGEVLYERPVATPRP